MSTILIPHLLLPRKGCDFNKWAVIACDQFTSQRDYWQRLDATCGDVSTLRLIFPEYYLGGADEAAIDGRVAAIHARMEDYLAADLFEQVDDFVLVERTLPTGGVRVGLVVAIDLEEYDYRPSRAAKIRATEATVESRLPIRVRIRRGAALELSHALALVDDSPEGVLERLYQKRAELPLLYDFELNMGGGHVRGYRVTDSPAVLAALDNLVAGKEFQYAVGDGNHSIAAAKTYWDELRQGLDPVAAAHHPARYCTCELVNLNAEGLTFHPIHRVVYDVDFDAFLAALSKRFAGEGRLDVRYEGRTYTVPAPSDPTRTIEQMAAFLGDFCRSHPQAKVDYIHGEAHLESVLQATHGIGVLMPSMPKNALFPYVAAHGILPKKAFSLGEAEEKRYYIEAKLIR